MSIDLAAAIGRLEPEKRRTRLSRRPLEKLTSAADVSDAAAIALVPDTNVYILDAAGRTSPEVAGLLDRASLFHCSVCLAEIAVGVANANPASPAWPALRTHYQELFASVPATRLLVPDAETWAEAGLIAGTLTRTQGYQKHQLKECLNDALIFLTAAKAGIPVLTENRDDFDLIQQLAPQGHFLHF